MNQALRAFCKGLLFSIRQGGNSRLIYVGGTGLLLSHFSCTRWSGTSFQGAQFQKFAALNKYNNTKTSCGIDCLSSSASDFRTGLERIEPQVVNRIKPDFAYAQATVTSRPTR